MTALNGASPAPRTTDGGRDAMTHTVSHIWQALQEPHPVIALLIITAFFGGLMFGFALVAL